MCGGKAISPLRQCARIASVLACFLLGHLYFSGRLAVCPQYRFSPMEPRQPWRNIGARQSYVFSHFLAELIGNACRWLCQSSDKTSGHYADSHIIHIQQVLDCHLSYTPRSFNRQWSSNYLFSFDKRLLNLLIGDGTVTSSPASSSAIASF